MRLTTFLLACAAMVASSAAFSFPDRPIRVIVPYDAGGTVDIVARVVQRAIEQHKVLPQPLTVINVTGGGGAVGIRQAKDAAPDGQTILVTHLGLLTSAAMGVIDFGPDQFVPIAEFGRSCFVYAIKAEAPYNSFQEFAAAARAEPGKFRDATNIGSAVHFGSLMLARAAGFELRFVQAGGGPARLQQMLSGTVETSLFTPIEFKNFQPTGLKALVSTAPERDPNLPDVPTARELGHDVSFCIGFWMFAPRGTPPDRVALLSKAVASVMARPDVQQEFRAKQQDPVFKDGEALAREIQATDKTIRELAAAIKK